MSRSKILLCLFAVLPSYFAIFQDSGAALFIIILSTLVGFVITAAASSDFDEDKKLVQSVRLGWIIHVAGIMIVYAVHQLS